MLELVEAKRKARVKKAHSEPALTSAPHEG